MGTAHTVSNRSLRGYASAKKIHHRQMKTGMSLALVEYNSQQSTIIIESTTLNIAKSDFHQREVVETFIQLVQALFAGDNGAALFQRAGLAALALPAIGEWTPACYAT